VCGRFNLRANAAAIAEVILSLGAVTLIVGNMTAKPPIHEVPGAIVFTVIWALIACRYGLVPAMLGSEIGLFFGALLRPRSAVSDGTPPAEVE